MISYFGGFWDTWNANHKVTFDPVNKLIIINPGIITLYVKSDIYSAWKEWMSFNENTNVWQLPAISAIGGDPISDTQALGSTYFLENGWRIKPWDGHNAISIIGNLFVREGGRPIVPDNGGIDAVAMTVSTLVETAIIDNTIPLDSTAPTWITTTGITDAYQNSDLINISWGTATDTNEVFYKIYISNNLLTLWDQSSLLTNSYGNSMSIGTEADGVTPLREVNYYIGVKASDVAGNVTSNVNYMQVNYIAPTTGDLLTSNDITAITNSIWSNSTRTLTETAGLTTEQQAQLTDIQTKINDVAIVKINEIIATLAAQGDSATISDIESAFSGIKIIV